MGKWTEAALIQRRVIDAAGAMLTDEQAATVPTLFPAWDGEGVSYAVGERVQYVDRLYKCLQPHVSQSTWTPADAPSLWAKVLIPDPNVIPEWIQPDSTNPYMKGDKVSYGGKIWVSDIDNNVWTPGVYGWSEI